MSRKGGRYIEAIAASLPSSSSLKIIEGYSETEVAETLKHSDTFIAVSVNEAFGLPPLEAMCAGCCVVGFPGDGGFEFMRHGETAHVVANGDVEGLKKAVRLIASQPEYRDKLRTRSLELSAYYTLDREREYLLRALGLE